MIIDYSGLLRLKSRIKGKIIRRLPKSWRISIRVSQMMKCEDCGYSLDLGRILRRRIAISDNIANSGGEGCWWHSHAKQANKLRAMLEIWEEDDRQTLQRMQRGRAGSTAGKPSGN